MPAIQKNKSAQSSQVSTKTTGSTRSLVNAFDRLNLNPSKKDLKAPVIKSLLSQATEIPDRYKPAQSRLTQNAEKALTAQNTPEYYRSEKFLNTYIPARLLEIQYACFIKDIPWDANAVATAKKAIQEDLKITTKDALKDDLNQKNISKIITSMKPQYSTSATGNEFKQTSHLPPESEYERLAAPHIKTASGRVFEILDRVSPQHSVQLSRFMEKPIAAGKTYLGSGSFSVVKFCFEPASNTYHAAKEMSQEELAKQETKCNFMIKKDEALLTMEDFAHIYSSNRYKKTFLIIPVMKNGNGNDFLQNLIKQNKINNTFNSFFLKKIIFAMISSVEILHRQNLVHRDIKPANFMLRNNDPTNPSFRLCDFGFTEPANRNPKEYKFQHAGTPKYTPDNYNSSSYTGLSHDSTSLGVLTLKISHNLNVSSTSKFSFQLQNKNLEITWSQKCVSHNIDRPQLQIPLNQYTNLNELAAGFLDKNSSTQLKAINAVKLDFFNDVRT